ncbi:MAG: Crp/Fnr family transcriptional regulator [Bacteroidota bacterium]
MNSLKSTVFPEGSCPNDHEKEALLALWTLPKKVNRFDFLIQRGRRASHLYFIKKGTMRIYYVTNRTEVCVGFGYANTLICSYPSFVQNQPSQYYIQALSDTELIGIPRQKFYDCLESSWNLEKHWRQMTERALLGRIEREIDLVTHSPKERLDRLLARSPHIFQLFAHKYIASYLRMTPETLSRILGQKTTKS